MQLKQLEQKDKLEDITRDLESLANIFTFLGIGCKEYPIKPQEMWFISDCLEKLATKLKEVRENL